VKKGKDFSLGLPQYGRELHSTNGYVHKKRLLFRTCSRVFQNVRQSTSLFSGWINEKYFHDLVTSISGTQLKNGYGTYKI
jgi:Ni,Fe-hydrogenase I cytochrome b subunit